ncbi:Os10g0157750 [Oryza sativa Japonica Group]|uniref:Os10g0157750 protein n=1 Tax=Oryza sativa subsp. japonica TaxID=39947 RepID=A0A0P0XRQ7_ORYSJ|nr:Os10g0157750 [Oryza sativa Japonica Group]
MKLRSYLRRSNGGVRPSSSGAVPGVAPAEGDAVVRWWLGADPALWWCASGVGRVRSERERMRTAESSWLGFMWRSHRFGAKLVESMESVEIQQRWNRWNHWNHRRCWNQRGGAAREERGVVSARSSRESCEEQQEEPREDHRSIGG